MADQTEKALDNLGVAVDTMKERITRLEEQMKTIYNSVDRVEKKLDKLIEQAGDHDVDVATNKIRIGAGERFFWVMVSAGIGLVIYWIKSG
tara:strand:- start:11997 stop:12269 length:273 start_codon:yes stop_codon:yes gene_type:complete